MKEGNSKDHDQCIAYQCTEDDRDQGNRFNLVKEQDSI